MKVKVCGMRDSENIMGVAKLKPDYMGFIFYEKSKRYVQTDFSIEHFKPLKKETKKVAVFVNEDMTSVESLCRILQFDHVQLHGTERPEYCAALKKKGYTVIKAFQISYQFNFDFLNNYKDCCDYFLFDSNAGRYGGSGESFDWKLLSEYDNEKPFFLSGGIDLEKAQSALALDQLNIHAIDVNSGFEVEPGLKDAAKLKQLFQMVRQPQ